MVNNKKSILLKKVITTILILALIFLIRWTGIKGLIGIVIGVSIMCVIMIKYPDKLKTAEQLILSK